jgi:hypothetical protein
MVSQILYTCCKASSLRDLVDDYKELKSKIASVFSTVNLTSLSTYKKREDEFYALVPLSYDRECPAFCFSSMSSS